MADVLEENNFLKSQLEAYQQELVRAREAYEKELSLYTLAQQQTCQMRPQKVYVKNTCVANVVIFTIKQAIR
jgi:hypothetical protein